MDFDSLKKKVMVMFPANKDETDEQYSFWVNNALDYLRGNINYDKAWEQIKLYDGMAKRPKFAFFKGIAGKTFEENKGLIHFYKCVKDKDKEKYGCGVNLSESSNGGCPNCHSSIHTESKYSYKDVEMIKVQSGCFDCSIYHDKIMCASCSDFGTPAYNECKFHRECPGRTCCKYEYMRTYKPDELKKIHDIAIRELPRPISEAGKAFQDGRASINDISTFLRSRR
jgi:hypothetical protein